MVLFFNHTIIDKDMYLAKKMALGVARDQNRVHCSAWCHPKIRTISVKKKRVIRNISMRRTLSCNNKRSVDNYDMTEPDHVWKKTTEFYIFKTKLGSILEQTK